jgi:hypothetical protein
MRRPNAKVLSVTLSGCGSYPVRVQVMDLSVWHPGPYEESPYGPTVHRSITIDGVWWADVQAVAR